MSNFALQHRSPRPPLHSVTEGAILPTLFCEGHALYGPRRSSIVVSFLGHTLAIMLLLAADKLVVPRHHEIRQQVVPLVTEVSPYILPPSASKAGGGGGGGDGDKLQASKGILPRFSREQLAPPAVIVRNENPKLAVEPAVVVPPEIHLSMPQTGPLGDPLSSILGPPSSGTGSGGGIGSGSGGESIV